MRQVLVAAVIALMAAMPAHAQRAKTPKAQKPPVAVASLPAAPDSLAAQFQVYVKQNCPVEVNNFINTLPPATGEQSLGFSLFKATNGSTGVAPFININNRQFLILPSGGDNELELKLTIAYEKLKDGSQRPFLTYLFQYLKVLPTALPNGSKIPDSNLVQALAACGGQFQLPIKYDNSTQIISNFNGQLNEVRAIENPNRPFLTSSLAVMFVPPQLKKTIVATK